MTRAQDLLDIYTIVSWPIRLNQKTGEMAIFLPGWQHDSRKIFRFYPSDEAGILKALGYIDWSNNKDYVLNEGAQRYGHVCVANRPSFNQEPPPNPGTSQDDPSLYYYWNVFETVESYLRYLANVGGEATSYPEWVEPEAPGYKVNTLLSYQGQIIMSKQPDNMTSPDVPSNLYWEYFNSQASLQQFFADLLNPWS